MRRLGKLRLRLIAVLCGLVVVVLAISSVFMMCYIEGRMRAQAHDNLTLTIRQLCSQISYIEGEMSQLSVRVAADGQVQSVIRALLAESGTNVAIINQRTLKDLLKSCHVDYSNVLSIEVLCANGIQCSSLGYFPLDSQNSIAGADWYEEYAQRPGVRRGFSGVHPFYWSGRRYDAITYVSPLVDLMSVPNQLGEVFVNVYFSQLLQYIQPLSTSFQYLNVRYDDVTIYAFGDAGAEGRSEDDLIEVRSPNGRIHVSALISSHDINAANAGAAKMVLLIIGIAMAAMVVVITGSVSRVTRPLSKLQQAALRMAAGDLSTAVSIHSGDELEALGNAFNEMVSRISAQIDEILASQCALNTARMELLVSQIKPHFIYNTLDSAIYMVQMNQSDEAVNLLRHFVQLLQNSMPPGIEGTFTTLNEEFRTISEYLDFQQLRYPNRYTFRLDYDVHTSQIQVPRMLLQPLIENALYHGVLASEERKGEILVRAALEGDALRITIADNGGGFDARWLATNWAEGGPEGSGGLERHGVGISNTIQRMRLFYGGAASFHIENRDGGAVCTLTLPLSPVGFSGWHLKSGGNGSNGTKPRADAVVDTTKLPRV